MQSYRSPNTLPSRLRRFSGAAMSLTLFVIISLAAHASAQAQTATVYGALSNFDVINNTEHEAHGFEIELEGLQPGDVYYTFNAQRYGTPQIVPYQTGVRVRWTSSYDAAASAFAQTTVAHAAGTPFAGTCYQWGGASYDTSGCEHFGVTLRTTALKTTYRWIVEDAQTPGTLVVVDPPVAIPAPTYVVLPAVRAAEAPVLEAEIEAPEPAEAPELYGNAQWVKVFKTEVQREVNLAELVSDNALVPQDAAHAEVAWEILQAEPASNSNGNRHRRQNQGNLNATTRAVVRRYEIYTYTGAYDPVTHQAVCADTLCNAPADAEVGDYVGAQMAAANVNVPAVTVAKTGSGSVSSTDRNISCGSKCASFYNAGATVTLVASAGSGNAFIGWGGACTGSQTTCTVTVNDSQTVTATFAPSVKLSVSTSGKGSVTCGGGGACASTVTQGTTATFTAAPAAGFRFTNWAGACSGTASTCDLTINKDTQVQAVFSKK